MSGYTPSNVTLLLNAIREGEAYRVNELFEAVYLELKSMAAGQLRHEGGSQRRRSATSLVHDAYARLVGDGGAANWENRGHFFTAAATAMRRILVEGALKAKSLKHGGNHKMVPLADVADGEQDLEQIDMLALDEALHALRDLEPRAEQVVMLRYFAGMTEGETARTLEVSGKTVQRDWNRAREWLLARIDGETASTA